MKPHGHLSLHSLELAAGQEWSFRGQGWGFIRIETGVGYWREHQGHRELSSGDVIVVPSLSQGCLLASRLTRLQGHCFRVLPEMLSGILSVSEYQRFRQPREDSRPLARIFDKHGEVAAAYSEICRSKTGHTVAGRVQLLRLFASVFKDDLKPAQGDECPIPEARRRLLELTGQLSARELSQISLAQLARRLNCSERHSSRVFLECFGVTLRQKQTELRMNRARRLLSKPETTIAEVARESGYRSLGPFNAAFKRLFGVTPSLWRDQGSSGKRSQEPSRNPKQIRNPKDAISKRRGVSDFGHSRFGFV